MPKILKKRNLISLLSILAVVAIIIIIFSSISLPKKVVIFNQSTRNIPVGEIYGERKIGQTFVAEYKNLSAIEVLLATYNRKNSGVFFFHLKSNVKSEEDIFDNRFDTRTVQDNEFFHFSFPKIKNSKRKKFYFYFEAPHSQPANAITIWSNSKDLYKKGEKIVNGVASEGDLVFKTEYEQGMKLSFNTFLGNIIKFKTFLVNIIWNKVFYSLLLILAFILAFITFLKKFGIFNKKGGFLLVYCISIIIIIIWIFVSFSKKIAVFNQPKNNIPVGEIYGDRKVGQTFVANYNNLSGIEMLLATYDRKNSGNFIFHLKKDVNSLKDLFHRQEDISKAKNNRYFHFQLPKIKNSKGKKFYFYLEAPQSQPGKAITIWSNSKDLYKNGEKVLNEKASEGDLVFKTTYDLGLKNNFNIFLEEIIQNKPFPLNKKSLYIIMIAFFVLSASLFMAFLAKFYIKS